MVNDASDAARTELFTLLGGWPEPLPSRAETLDVQDCGVMIVERLRLRPTRPTAAAAVAALPAILTRPPGDGPFPAVLYCHAHGGRYEIGKQELLDGRPALALSCDAYGLALARRGVAALCIDMPCFGERTDDGEAALAKKLLWYGDTLFGMMLRELASGVDYLQSRADIDGERIAALGLSMGSTTGWWLAALDQRIGAVAELCCLADLATLIELGAHDRHGIYMSVPGLLARFSTAEIAGLIVPRPHLCMIGALDSLTPPAAVEKVTAALAQAYAAAGRGDAWQLLIESDSGHVETAAMREAALAFLCAQLDVAIS